MKRKYDVVLFDMDGTIANTDEMLVESFNKMFDLYRDGKRSPKEEIYYYSGPALKTTLLEQFPDGDQEALFKAFYKISGELYDSMVYAYPNCRYVILKLKEAGIKVAVVTNKATQMANHCLDVIGLENIFDLLIGFSDVKNPKPDPEGILLSLEKLGCNDKKRVLYVGDNPIDHISAKNAGVDSCLVNWGPRKFKMEEEPTHRIDQYSDLLKVCLDEE